MVGQVKDHLLEGCFIFVETKDEKFDGRPRVEQFVEVFSQLVRRIIELTFRCDKYPAILLIRNVIPEKRSLLIERVRRVVLQGIWMVGKAPQ